MASKQRMLHHVSFHFGKSRVLFSVPGTTTLLDLKRTLLSALPMLKSDAPGASSGLPGLSAEEVEAMDLPAPSGAATRTPLDDVQGTADIVLWRPRRHVETMDRFEAALARDNPGEQSVDPAAGAGWVCLEGDPGVFEERGGVEQGERRDALAVQIRDLKQPAWERWVDVYVSFRDGDVYPEPTVQHPSLEDGEYGDEEE